MAHDHFSASPEPAAIAALYQQYAPVLLVYLRRRAASWEDAEDILLEVFLSVLEQPGVFSIPEGQRLFWLRRVAQHKLVDYHRRAARRPTVALDGIGDTLVEDKDLEPEQIALRHEEQSEVFQAFQRLPETYQEVLHLRFGYDLRCAEIGTMLGKQEGAIRALLWRALKLLRACYDDILGGHPYDTRRRTTRSQP
jgi:RNA polymerase sigma-70 factor (ECF subfamily)